MTGTTPASPGPAQGPGELALPRPPGLFRRWIDRHPRTVDIVIATVTVLMPSALIPIMAGPFTGWPLILTGFVCAAALFAATLLRRRIPFALLVIAAITGVIPLVGEPLGVLSAWIALYSLAVFASSKQAWIGFSLATLVWFVSFVITNAASLAFAPDAAAPAGWLQVVALFLQAASAFIVPTLVGLWVGGRRRYERALIARAEDLARERDQRAQLAVSEERTRIAREMHDIVSHSLTVMITLSEGAAAQAEAGSDRAPDAMRRVADTGRDSLAEMRRLLGVLRAPDAPAELAPLPVNGSIQALVSQFRDAGLPVRWRGEGDPIPSGGGVALTTYRIVQESLTNVLRHAPHTRHVDVTATNFDDTITLTIDNETTTASHPADGTGRGLVGMRERAALHDGTVEAGPRPDGRWRVRATLSTKGTT